MTLSEKAVNFVRAHQRRFKYLGLTLIIIIAAYLTGITYLRNVNKKGQQLYDTAYYFAIENMKSGLDTENLEKQEELFKKVINEYGMSKAAHLALAQVAHIKFLEKKYDEAIDLYQEYSHKISGSIEYKSMVNLAVATCYEAKGEIKKAIETLNIIVEDQDNPFKETGMLSLARLYKLDNRHEKATEILNKFIEEYQDSPFLPMAKASL